jgi:DNA-binding IscR family transcriptional regulator
VAEEGRTDCPLHGQCVFGPMWERAREALANVFDETTFQDLLDEEAKRQSAQALSYTI